MLAAGASGVPEESLAAGELGASWRAMQILAFDAVCFRSVESASS